MGATKASLRGVVMLYSSRLMAGGAVGAVRGGVVASVSLPACRCWLNMSG